MLILCISAVAKPVGGVFDLASNVGQGIRNSATPTDTNDIARIRYPRYIGPDSILKVRDKGGDYMSDELTHCDHIAVFSSRSTRSSVAQRC